jgi:hypothetical protein
MFTLAMVALLLYYANKSGFDQGSISLWSILYLIFAIPNCFLHFQYYYYNHRTVLDILPEQAKLIWTNKASKSETIEFSEINKIIVFMAPSKYRGNKVRLVPFEDYYYAKIYTSSGNEIVITSLMAPNVEDTMRTITGVPIERKIKHLGFSFIG